MAGAAQTTTHERSWLSTAEASRALGVHPDTLRRWADAGHVPVFVTPGNHRRFDRRDISRVGRAAAPVARTSPTERLMLDYCRESDRDARAVLLRRAERHGAAVGRDAGSDGRSLGGVVTQLLSLRARALGELDRHDRAATRDADEIFDRILVGVAASRALPARQ